MQMTQTPSVHRDVLAVNVDQLLVPSSIMLRQISAYFQNTNKPIKRLFCL